MGGRAPANKRVLIVGGGRKNGADQLVDYPPVLFRPHVFACMRAGSWICRGNGMADDPGRLFSSKFSSLYNDENIKDIFVANMKVGFSLSVTILLIPARDRRESKLIQNDGILCLGILCQLCTLSWGGVGGGDDGDARTMRPSEEGGKRRKARGEEKVARREERSKESGERRGKGDRRDREF